MALLADADRLQCDVRTVPHPRTSGHAAPDLHVRPGHGLGFLEHGVHGRLVHDRGIDLGLHLQRVALTQVRGDRGE